MKTGAMVEPTEPQTTSATSPSASPSATKAKASGSVCQDALGDSTVADIDQVKLISDGSLMFMTFTTASTLPAMGTVLYSVTAWSPDGKTGYQIGTKFQNGVEASNFVFNLITNKQENITNRAVAADNQVSTRYPLAKLAGLGDTFGWHGSVTVNGSDVDACSSREAKTTYPN